MRQCAKIKNVKTRLREAKTSKKMRKKKASNYVLNVSGVNDGDSWNFVARKRKAVIISLADAQDNDETSKKKKYRICIQ